MNIRSKIIMITLPLIISPLILTMVVSTLSTRNGITIVATEFLKFKTKIMINYMESQWNLLTSNDLDENRDFIEVSKTSVESYSKTLVGSESEKIWAVDYSCNLTMMSSDITLDESAKIKLREMIEGGETGWQDLTINGKEMIAETSFFEPFEWYLLVTVERDAFYGTLNEILLKTMSIFIISLLVSVLLLILFSRFLTRPLNNITEVIRNIILTNDLSTKVTLQYKDETGELGHYFNIMTQELDLATRQMKRYALQSVIAHRNEMKIRNIFQKYVPRNVIDKYYSEPESMLEGDSRVLAILFSDIRGFTTISEGLPPDELVESLNKYFEFMVDVITEHEGIVDKYIGDAIMAFYGAPVHHDNDALQAVISGLDMIDRLEEFNRWQDSVGRAKFKIGIGINYGVVTIGNIGTEKKMDYTVIGDMVNLASRIEDLTKLYQEPLLITESIYLKVFEFLPCRMIDRVIVKGKSKGVNIYTVRRVLSDSVKEAWAYHETGIVYYYKKEFRTAKGFFQMALDILPDDYCSKMFLKRCEHYIARPPGADWVGDTVLEKK